MDKIFDKFSINELILRLFPGAVVFLLVMIDIVLYNTFSQDKIDIFSIFQTNIIGSINIFLIIFLLGSVIFVIHRYTIGESLFYKLQLAVSHIICIRNNNLRHSDSEFFINLGYKYIEVRTLYIIIRKYLLSLLDYPGNICDKITPLKNRQFKHKLDAIRSDEMCKEFITSIERKHADINLYYISFELVIINTAIIYLISFPYVYVLFFLFVSIAMLLSAVSADARQHIYEITFFNYLFNKHNNYDIRNRLFDLLNKMGFIRENNDENAYKTHVFLQKRIRDRYVVSTIVTSLTIAVIVVLYITLQMWSI